jgi:predicted  nucleic acid-binding Zn ribbon protein
MEEFTSGLCLSSGDHVHTGLTINHERARAEGEGVLGQMLSPTHLHPCFPLKSGAGPTVQILG